MGNLQDGYDDVHPLCEVCLKFGKRKYCGYRKSHHIKTRGAGGIDEWSNLIRLCWGHHREVEKIGIKQFAIKYAIFKMRDALIKRGRWSDGDQERFKENEERFQRGIGTSR